MNGGSERGGYTQKEGGWRKKKMSENM